MPEMIPTDGNTVAVVGGGLGGALAAIALQQRGFTVHLFEGREDWRVDTKKALDKGEDQSRSAIKRSINLAMSHRGRRALAAVGLEEAAMADAIPMRCRAIHSDAATGGNPDSLLPYDQVDSTNAIYSVGRERLNNMLLDRAEALDHVTVHFGAKLTHISPDGMLHFCYAATKRTSAPGTYNDYQQGDILFKPRLTIGADGAYSATREAMLRLQPLNFKREYIPHGYKELTIPPDPKTGDFAMSVPEALHVWPRGEFMLIGLPNPDKSFTCTLFAPFKSGKDSLTGADLPGMLDQETPAQIESYFQKYFPDVIPLIPDYIAEYQRNPACQLVTIRARPWNFNDSIVLIGDAAHATVPFYGQGMNAAFEDVMVLCEYIDKHSLNLAEAIPAFAADRQPDGEAIGTLSLHNYRVMSHSSGSALFRLQKRFEGVLNWAFPTWWIPLYKMVAFTSIPYAEAIERAEAQDRALERAGNVLKLGTAALAIYAAWTRLDQR